MRLSICLLAMALAVAAGAQEPGNPTTPPAASQDEFVAWAREHAILLETDSDSFGRASLDQLKRVIGNAHIVALGEPMHGAHEPLAFRNELLRFLVEEAGFTAIAVESGLSESRRLYDYVLGELGEAGQVALDGFTWGFGAYPENVELLRWVRRYNADPAHERKVRVYGIDLSGGALGEFPDARVALDDALVFLSAAAPDASATVRAALLPWLEQFGREDYARMTQAERRLLSDALAGLVAFLEAHREALTEATSPVDFEWACRNAVVAKQLEEMFRLWPMETSAQSLSPEMHKAMKARDSAMAKNVMWALEREGPKGRVLVFAHNAHVMNASLRGGMWNVLPQPLPTMGQHLRNVLEDDLLIVGTSSASTGSDFQAAAGPVGSLDAALARIATERFLIDLRNAQTGSGAGLWLRRMQSLRANLTTELRLAPREAFDAVVHLGRLTPAGSRLQRDGGRRASPR